LAVAAGTFAVALWLVRRGASRWLALLYGFYPGMFVGLWRDLSEPLSYALATLAIVVFDGERPRRLGASAALFAGALLTRETTAVFVLAWAGALFVRHRGRALWFAAAALAPCVAWRVFAAAWLGTATLGGEAPLGVVVAAVLAVPALAPLLRRTRGWLLTPAVAWFLPWAVLLVFAFRRTWT